MLETKYMTYQGDQNLPRFRRETSCEILHTPSISVILRCRALYRMLLSRFVTRLMRNMVGNTFAVSSPLTTCMKGNSLSWIRNQSMGSSVPKPPTMLTFYRASRWHMSLTKLSWDVDHFLGHTTRFMFHTVSPMPWGTWGLGATPSPCITSSLCIRKWLHCFQFRKQSLGYILTWTPHKANLLKGFLIASEVSYLN
jgi:hypothetical protein